MQYLGEMPWVSRATAVRPDPQQMIPKSATVKKGSEIARTHRHFRKYHLSVRQCFSPSCCGGRKAEVKKSGPVPLNLRPSAGLLSLKTCGETQAPRQTEKPSKRCAALVFTRRLRMGRAKAAISHHFSLSVARQVAKLVDQSRVETRMKEDWLCEVSFFWRLQSS